MAGSSGLTLHVVLALLMALPFAPHVWAMRPRPRPPDYLDRGRLPRRALLLAGGALAWQSLEAVSRVAGFSGAARRFTGSRDAGGSGADFPRTSWLLDRPSPIDPTGWRLRVEGAVVTPLALALTDLTPDESRRAILDCTGGWYADREWRGVAVSGVLVRAGLKPGTRSVVVEGVTGYRRRFSLSEARSALLAVRVGGEPLGHGHGAPLRLVVPGHRGYDWVKWVTRIEASRLPPWWNWPLPVR